MAALTTALARVCMETLKAFDRLTSRNEEASREGSRTRSQEPQFANLSDYIAQPIWVVTSNGYGERFNPYWESYTGLSQEESCDFGWSRAFHAEDLGDFIERLRNPERAGGWEFEARLRRGTDGSYRRHMCRGTQLTNQANGRIHLLVCCTDVEEWRKAETSAKEQGTWLGLAVRGHDQEKRKIAHALHDNAGQYLVALQMKLDGLQRFSMGNTGQKNSVVEDCRELVKRCAKELRTTSYLLYPPLLDDLGLESAIRLHVDGFMERTRAKIEVEIEPNLGRLDRDLEIALFRVVQNALANIHRQCGRQSGNAGAEVKIGASATSVFVEVRASGGFPDKFTGAHASSELRMAGLGLATLRHRILEAGGVFEIESPANGMVIRTAVPRKALVAHPCD